MPVTEQQRRAIAFLVKARRDTLHGATKWDEPGIDAALSRVSGLDLADVTIAAMRAANDRDLKTPALIGDTSSSAWRERTAERVAPRHPFDAATHCAICSEEQARCRSLWADDHEFESTVEARRRKGQVDIGPAIAALKASVETTRPPTEPAPREPNPRVQELRAALHPDPAHTTAAHTLHDTEESADA